MNPSNPLHSRLRVFDLVRPFLLLPQCLLPAAEAEVVAGTPLRQSASPRFQTRYGAMKATFRPDAATTCLIKLLVGPGNPGTPGAPSTSAGIGIEVWLPAAARFDQLQHTTCELYERRDRGE